MGNPPWSNLRIKIRRCIYKHITGRIRPTLHPLTKIELLLWDAMTRFSQNDLDLQAERERSKHSYTYITLEVDPEVISYLESDVPRKKIGRHVGRLIESVLAELIIAGENDPSAKKMMLERIFRSS